VELDKKVSAHVACSTKKGKSPQMASYGPFNFEGDELYLNLLRIIQTFGGISSFVIHITYYGKVAKFLQVVA
jgi:hypothetical protein